MENVMSLKLYRVRACFELEGEEMVGAFDPDEAKELAGFDSWRLRDMIDDCNGYINVDEIKSEDELDEYEKENIRYGEIKLPSCISISSLDAASKIWYDEMELLYERLKREEWLAKNHPHFDFWETCKDDSVKTKTSSELMSAASILAKVLHKEK